MEGSQSILSVNVANFVSITIMALAGLAAFNAAKKAYMGRQKGAE